MSIHATVTIRCDNKSCAAVIAYTPPLRVQICNAMARAEDRAATYGWDVENVYHLCPTCAREKKHGPAQWSKEVTP